MGEDRLLATPLSRDPASGIQDIFRQLADSIERSQRVVEDVPEAYRAGRSILVLTERTEHLDKLEMALSGRLIGEGFDHPPLDTLMLAMPISWKGTLQQYAGRLHREHANKSDVLIHDYVDTGNPVLERMWEKRQRGYRAMGYQIIPSLEKLT